MKATARRRRGRLQDRGALVLSADITQQGSKPTVLVGQVMGTAILVELVVSRAGSGALLAVPVLVSGQAQVVHPARHVAARVPGRSAITPHLSLLR